MCASLANMDTFPAYPVEIKVRVEKFQKEKSFHRAFVCDSTGFANIVMFGDLQKPIEEGKCYSFMVSLGKEFHGKRDLTMNLNSFPYTEIPQIPLDRSPVSVTSAILKPGYRYCIRARVRKDGVKAIPRDDRTLYLWTINLSDGKTQCPVKIWGSSIDPLPDVRDGLYDVFCLSYVPSSNPQYPVGHFDARNARWVCVEPDTMQSPLPACPSPSEPTNEPMPVTEARTEQMPEPSVSSEPKLEPLPNQPRRIIEAFGATPHLPADCAGIVHSLAEVRLMVSCLEKVFESAVEYEKMHGSGSFYRTPGAVDTLAVLRDGSVNIPVIDAASVNFGIDVLQSLLTTASLRRV